MRLGSEPCNKQEAPVGEEVGCVGDCGDHDILAYLRITRLWSGGI